MVLLLALELATASGWGLVLVTGVALVTELAKVSEVGSELELVLVMEEELVGEPWVAGWVPSWG